MFDVRHQQVLVRLLAVLGCGLILILTNRWLAWDAGIQFLSASDIYSYQAIAEAAPALPSGQQLIFHHAQRLAIPYGLGLVARFLAVPIPVVFGVAIAVCIAAIIGLVHQCLKQLRLDPVSYGLCMAILILNPYTFRYYLIARGMVPDLVFVVGLAAVLLGLSQRKFLWVISGALIAALGRQTAVMLIPGVALWLIAGQGWQSHTLTRKLVYVLATIFVIALTYQITGSIAASFALPSQNLQTLDISRWLFSDRLTLGIFAEHVFRVVIPTLVPLGAIAGIVLANPRQVTQHGFPRVEFISSLLIAACIMAQPFLAGPDITGQNGSRLGALSFVAVLMALALFMSRHSPLAYAKILPILGLLGASLAVSSLHHLYTVVGPLSASQFALLQLSVTIVITVVLFRVAKVQY